MTLVRRISKRKKTLRRKSQRNKYSYLMLLPPSDLLVLSIGHEKPADTVHTDFSLLQHQKGQFSSAQSLSRIRLFATPWIAACQASLSTNSQILLKLMSIEWVMPSNHLILCHPLLLLPSIFPSIRGFSNELALRIRWPKYWSFSFSISPSNEYSGLIFFRTDFVWSPFRPTDSWVFSNPTVQKH